MRTWKRCIALLPFLLVAVACSHTIPPYTAKPVPPQQFTPPTPDAIEVPEVQLPDSALPVTLVLDLTPLEETLQASMPEHFSEAFHPLQKDYRWDFVREAEPQVTIQDGLVTIHSTYRGDIEANTASRGCRLDPVFPILNTTGKLELEQEGNALVLRLKSPQIDIDLKPESESKCNMFNIPVKDQLAELLNTPMLVESMTRAVEESGYQVPLEQVWTKLQAPVAVNVVKFNTQACIYGKPTEMAIGTLKGTVQRTTIPIVVNETPTATFENSCAKPTAEVMKITSGAALLEGKPYKVLASVSVPYSEVNRELQERLVHQPVKDPNVDMVINKATASDSGGKALFTINTTGDLNGTIYYWGTPQLEGEGSVMTMSDLQMASESKTMLEDIKVGYWKIIDQQLRDKLQTATRVDLSDRIAKMKSAITGTHASGDVTREITIGQQQPQRAYSIPGALVADILLEGSANLTAPVELATRSMPGKTPDKISIFSQPPTQR
ncbi:DUF4403 family protein [Candidatus Nitrospira allomarina]|uniref:DUF4403 family protein n=1 Tax=Candidatus Nitrospira allomarina TaxID=3020900 RepID=A0AA96GIS0_9BACT|nr:DUF4403 family protein [Candidatus Nitrospira allomarina]WNM59703.1 DUF4403 family protein [Candidatus Nitrospira allomarina]